MGGTTYGRVGEGFEIPRPVWAEIKDDVAKIPKKEQAQIRTFLGLAQA